MDRKLTPVEAALILEVSPQRVGKFRDRGDLAAVKEPDGRVFYMESSVRAFAEYRKAHPRQSGRPRKELAAA